MSKIVISGSASMQSYFIKWKENFESNGNEVLAYPMPISKENFINEYPQVHNDFFNNITKCDELFVLNEDKNEIVGYIGAAVFAEIVFAVMQNRLYNKNIEVVIYKMPSKEVKCYDEIALWLELGWIKIYNK